MYSGLKSPGFFLPTTGCTRRPSQVSSSIAFSCINSCPLCWTFRVWKPSTLAQPLSSNSLRNCFGVSSYALVSDLLPVIRSFCPYPLYRNDIFHLDEGDPLLLPLGQLIPRPHQLLVHLQFRQRHPKQSESATRCRWLAAFRLKQRGNLADP